MSNDTATAARYTVTDTAGSFGSITTERADLIDAMIEFEWFPGAPDEVRSALADLDRKLRRGEDITAELAFLGLEIEPEMDPA